MTNNLGTFPFGQPVQRVVQQNRSPKKVFVLGVCLIASKGVVVEISVCEDADKPKAGRVWTKVEKVKI